MDPLFKVQLLYVSYALTIKRSLLIDETMIVHAVVYESAAMVTDLKTVLCLGSLFINTSNVCNVIGLHIYSVFVEKQNRIRPEILAILFRSHSADVAKRRLTYKLAD